MRKKLMQIDRVYTGSSEMLRTDGPMKSECGPTAEKLMRPSTLLLSATTPRTNEHLVLHTQHGHAPPWLMMRPAPYEAPATNAPAPPPPVISDVRQAVQNNIRQNNKKPTKLKPVGTPTSDEEDFSTTAIKVNVIAELSSPNSDEMDDFDVVSGGSDGNNNQHGQSSRRQQVAVTEGGVESVSLRRERNRLAAQRCRQRRRDRIDKLELVCSKLNNDGSQLEREIADMERELLKLQNVLQTHDCVSVASLVNPNSTSQNAPSHHVSSTHTASHNTTSHHAMPHSVSSYNVSSHNVATLDDTSHNETSHYTMSHGVPSHNAALHNSTSHNVTVQDVTPHNTKLQNEHLWRISDSGMSRLQATSSMASRDEMMTSRNENMWSSNEPYMSRPQTTSSMHM